MEERTLTSTWPLRASQNLQPSVSLDGQVWIVARNFLFGCVSIWRMFSSCKEIAKYLINFKRHPDDKDIESRLFFPVDNDKQLHYTMHKYYGNARDTPLGKEIHLMYVHRVRDIRLGFKNQVILYVAADIFIVCKFKHVQHTMEMDTFNHIMKALFSIRGYSESNRASRATLTLVTDRG